jgi:hypothetical protein
MYQCPPALPVGIVLFGVSAAVENIFIAAKPGLAANSAENVLMCYPDPRGREAGVD